MILDYNDVNGINRYKLMSDTVVPRPIAWIVTEDDGVINAAPFSYFTPLSSDPATLIVSIGHKDDGTPKDSLSNILKTKKATICFVNLENMEQVKKCALPLGKDESEVEKFQIEVQKVMDEYPPMISSSQSALFCEFYDKVEMPGKTVPVILELKHQYVEDDRIDAKHHVYVDNLGRNGAYFKSMVDVEC